MHPTPYQAPRPANGNVAVLSVVLVYAVFAAIWILLSDKALDWLFDDPRQMALASTYKGWFFVAVTSLLLYGLLRRLAGRASETPAPYAAPAASRLLLPFVLLAAAIATLTAMVVAQTYTHQREQELARVQAIARIKSRQVTDWLKERQADSDFVRTSRHYADLYRHWRETGDRASLDALMGRLEFLRASRGFAAVSLLDARGARLAGDAHAPRSNAAPLTEAARQAAADGRMHRIGPYLGVAGHTRLDFITPLALSGPQPGIVVLHSDTAGWLRQTLDDWPNPSASGEALLVRRDGDHLLLLSEPRLGKGLGMRRRMPINDPFMLAGPALRGEATGEQPLAGVDYRGQPVLGVARAIADSDWFLVAKVDQAEVRAKARGDAVWIGLAGLLALLITAAGFHLLRQRQQLIIADSVRLSQDERLRALKLLEAFAESSDDAIFAKDLEGRYLLCNRAAGLFVGKPPEAVLGRDDRELFPPEQAQMLMELDRRAIRENRVRTEEEVLDTPQGKRVFLATKGPLRDEHDRIIGTFGISRDISESRQAESALAEQMRRFHLLLDSSRDGIVIIDQEHRVVEANQRFADMLGYVPAELLRLHTWDFDAQLSEAQVRAGFSDLDHVRTVFETRHRRADGSEYDVEISASSAVWGGQNLVLCICRDITERKQAERAVRESEARFRALVEQSLAGIYIIQDGHFRYVNPGFAAIYGYEAPEELIDRVKVEDLVAPADRARVLDNIRRRVELETTDIHYTFAGLRRDGHPIEVEVHGRAFEYQGRPAVIGLILDVTARKAAEASLRQVAEDMDATLRAIPDLLFELDAEGRYLTVKATQEALLAAPANMLIGRTVTETLPPEAATTVREALAAAARTGADYGRTIMLPLAQGPSYFELSVARKADFRDRPTRFVMLSRDITGRKLAEEELRQRNLELERFNQATVDRELDMIEMKKRINALSRELGREPPYPLAFLEGGADKVGT